MNKGQRDKGTKGQRVIQGKAAPSVPLSLSPSVPSSPRISSSPSVPLSLCPSVPSSPPSAFTLTELLVVIAIIVLFITLALPAFNLITGGRSIAAGTNEVAAFLGRARAEAIGAQEVRGVGLYIDASTQRATLAIVQQPYQLTEGASAYNSAASSYSAGTYVTSGGTRYFVAVHDMTSPVAALPTGTSPIDSADWVETDFYAVDVTPDSDALQLPLGVGVQLLNNCTFNANGTVRTSNGYVSFGAVLFDGSGSLTSKRISIAHGGIIGKRAGITENLPYYGQTRANNIAVSSQFGLVLFDSQSYQNAGGSFAAQSIFTGPAAPVYNSSTSEFAQEHWLDINATPLLINRYNGTLIKSE